MIEKEFKFLDRTYRLVKQNEEHILYEYMHNRRAPVYIPVNAEDVMNIKQQNDEQVINLLKEWDVGIYTMVELDRGGDIEWKK